MKVLLDENLPNDLRHFLPGHEVFTVAYMGWKGVENGALLAKAASEGFDAVVTMDTGAEFEKSATGLPLAAVLLRAASNKLETLRLLVPDLLKALGDLRPGTVVVIGDAPSSSGR
jgi:hypothetical protein